MYPRRYAVLAGAALACTSPAGADAADLNVAVAAKVIAFRQSMPPGSINAAIIFDPGDSGSVAEAASIERSIGAGVPVGKAMLRVRRVPVGQIGALTGGGVAFVTSGLRDRYADIAAVAQKNSILTVTADSACVQAGHCAVAVSSTPKVQITVNRAACKAAHIEFGSAFLMLVKEI